MRGGARRPPFPQLSEAQFGKRQHFPGFLVAALGFLLHLRDAALETGEGTLVYRVKNGKVEAVKARLGPTDGDLVSVIEGLAEGDQVARGGLGNLSDGAAIKVAVSVTQKD